MATTVLPSFSIPVPTVEQLQKPPIRFSTPALSHIGKFGDYAVNSSGWPDWLTGAHTFAGSKDLGISWHQLLFYWTELERAYKFASPGGAVRIVASYCS